MVGMDVVDGEKSIEMEFVSDDVLKLNENGDFQSSDLEVPLGKLTALCPITPSPCRESGDSVLGTNSPLSLESSSSQSPKADSESSTGSDGIGTSGPDDSPRTPDEGVFNPFAPGPEEMLLAPICKKLMIETRRIVARRLSFDPFDDVQDAMGKDADPEVVREKIVLDTVYEALLEAIILEQTKDFLEESQPLELESPRTPTSPPRLTGFAETCPGAPLKASTDKARKIDPELCRKLEF